MTNQARMRIADAKAAVDASADGLYGILLEHGTLELGFYQPGDTDEQEPHDRDEVYIVTSGSGRFRCGDRTSPVETGEALFVPAGVEHRFIDYTADFACWVMFYGPAGGEHGKPD